MITSYSRGHLIVYDDSKSWCYVDTGLPINNRRPCAKCGKTPLYDGEDACLGHIFGAKNACCGHGIDSGYIIYDDQTDEVTY